MSDSFVRYAPRDGRARFDDEDDLAGALFGDGPSARKAGLA